MLLHQGCGLEEEEEIGWILLNWVAG